MKATERLNPHDEELLSTFLDSLLAGRLSERLRAPPGFGLSPRIVDKLNRFVSNLESMANTQSSTQEKLSHLIEGIARMARLDFATRLPIAGDGSDLDAIATGLNMLCEELQQNSVAKTEYQKQNTELRKERNFSQLLINTSPMVTFVMDVQSKANTYISPNVEHLLGYSADEIVGMKSEFYSKVYAPHEIPDSVPKRAEIAHLADGSVDVKSLRIRHKDGHWIYVRRHAKVIERAEDGSPRTALGLIENISEEVKRDEELARLAAALPIIVSYFDSEEKNLLSNKAFSSLVGISPEKMKDLTLLEIVGAGLYQKHRRNLRKVLLGIPQSFVTEAKPPGREPVFYFVSLVPRRSGEKVEGFYASAIDVTQIKKLEREVSKQKRLFESVVENIPVAVFLKDANDDFRVKIWNKAAEEIFGVPRGEIIGRTVFDLWPKELAEKFFKADEKAIRENIKIDLPEEVAQSKARGTILIHTRKMPFVLEKKERYLLAICDDVTASRETQRELEQTQAALESAAIVGVTDPNGAITHVNQNFIDISGYSREELIGENHRLVNSGYHSRDFFRNLWETIRSGKVWRGEIRNRAKDGSYYWTQSVIAPIRDVSGGIKKYISMRFDITAEKAAQLTLIQSAKMASLGEMAGGIAHEINNPVGVIHGKASQLLRLLKSENWRVEKAVEQLEKIVTEADRIAKIVRGLRTFSRNADKDPFAPVQIQSLIDDVVGLCSERFRNHSVGLEIGQVPMIAIECRSTQIAQVLSNLLNNSFDAVSALPVKWVRVETEQVGECVRISVTDSGAGISPHISDKLMQPFFTTKEPGKGTGLGLSISRGIVTDHGGKLWLDKASPNTRFIMELPIKQQSQPRNAA